MHKLFVIKRGWCIKNFCSEKESIELKLKLSKGYRLSTLTECCIIKVANCLEMP